MLTHPFVKDGSVKRTGSLASASFLLGGFRKRFPEIFTWSRRKTEKEELSAGRGVQRCSKTSNVIAFKQGCEYRVILSETAFRQSVSGHQLKNC
jgi:hypothetical protein